MKSKKIQFLKSIIYFVIIFILVGTYNNIVAEEIYYPSPIIFVHGVDSDDSTWNSAERELRKYFYNTDGTCKYFDYGYDYLIFAGYADQNNGDIPTIARTALKNEVYYATDRLPDGYKKVNIVTHSMGGLVTRSFLKQFSSVYQSNINKVIFIGTPHLGAPSASALWILNKIRNEIIQPALRDYNSFYSQSSGSRFRFADKSGIVMASGLPVGIYNGLTGKLSEELANIDLVLTNADRFGPDPAGTALTQLRLSNNVYYHKTISAGLLWDKKEINIDAMIAGNNTFLGQASQNLAIPNNFKTVRGDISPLRNFFSWILSWGISQTIDLFNNNFTFPQGQSLLDAKNTGDGIVTMASQEGIGSADYIVNAFHTDEPKAWQPILQAIEDTPIIESAYAIPVDWNKTYATPTNDSNSWYYLIFKLKDYLLADIEIESLTLDGQDIIPASFKMGCVAKPYNALNKRFLQERDCDDEQKELAEYYDILNDKGNQGVKKYLHLMPGEFYVKTKIPLNAQSIYIKIKNPAAQYDSTKFTAEKILTITRPKVINVDWKPHLSEIPTGTAFWGWGFDRAYPATIDIPPLCYGDKGIRGAAPEYLDFSFRINDSPYQNARINAWLYGWKAWVSFTGYCEELGLGFDWSIVWKKFATAREISLSGLPYSKVINDIPRWYGDSDREGYTKIVATPDPYYLYKVKITVEPVDDPKDDILALLGSNWDIGSTSVNDPEHNFNVVVADPTFIQASRREGISW